MDPLSNVDRLTLMLRLRLKESVGKSSGMASAGLQKATQQRPETPDLAAAAKSGAISALHGANKSDAARVVVQQILQEGLGSDYINDPQFQSLVNRVLEAVQSDDESRALLDRTVSCVTRPEKS